MGLGLWSPEMKNQIIANNGSIQNIPEIPGDLKSLYKVKSLVSSFLLRIMNSRTLSALSFLFSVSLMACCFRPYGKFLRKF